MYSDAEDNTESLVVACGFPTDVREGGENLTILLVAAVAYVYPG